MWRRPWCLGSIPLLLGGSLLLEVSLFVPPAGETPPMQVQREDAWVRPPGSHGTNQSWMIGISGHEDGSPGFAVDETFAVWDHNARTMRAPAREFYVRTPAGWVIWNLEPGDRILAIDYMAVNNLNDLVLAINSSQSLPTLTIEFRDFWTGTEYKGTITAARVRDSEK